MSHAKKCKKHRKEKNSKKSLSPTWLPSLEATSAFFWRRKWQPTPVFLPGEFPGWRSLVGYSPLGHKESDMTE